MQTSNANNASNDIATAAYYQWVNAGCPTGRDQEFWLKAERELKQNGQAVPAAVATPKAGNPTSSNRSTSHARRTR